MITVTRAAAKIAVWDPVVRIGHWILVAGFFVAYFTEDDLLTAHVWAGYTVGAVVILRVVWGFVGSRNARFSSFLYGPIAALKYLAGLLRRTAPRYIGHSPAGAFMIFLLLAGLAATVASGLTVYAYDQHAGPLAPFIGAASASNDEANEGADAARAAQPSASAEAREHMWEEVHETLANVTLALVALHILGVLLASLVHRENLVAAMITGKKRAESDEQGSLRRHG